VFHKLTAARSQVPCGRTVVLLKRKEVAREVTVLETVMIFCHRKLRINNSAIKYYFLINFAVLSQTHSKTSAFNFFRIYSDLAFLSHIA